MNRQNKLLKEISYALSAQTGAGRALILVMEHAGGRRRMLQSAMGYEAEVAVGKSFWRVMIERCGIDLKLIKEFRGHVVASFGILIGGPFSRENMYPYLNEPSKLMDFLRQKTYDIAPEPLDAFGYGYEFEERHRA